MREAVSKTEVEAIAVAHLADDSVTLLFDKTIETEFGWVFFYQSREYLESGDPSAVLAGNAPVIVDRRNGQVHLTGTAYPLDQYVAKYRNTDR